MFPLFTKTIQKKVGDLLPLFLVLFILFCLGIGIVSILFPKKTQEVGLELSTLTSESTNTSNITNDSKLEYFFSCSNIQVNSIGLYLTTFSKTLDFGTLHYRFTDSDSKDTLYEGSISLTGQSDDSFALLPIIVKENLNGEYLLTVTFSDIPASDSFAFKLSPNTNSDMSLTLDGLKNESVPVAILYDETNTYPLLWDSILFFFIGICVFIMIPDKKGIFHLNGRLKNVS